MNLNAGPIQLHYENGFIRTLTANGEEMLRMIYFGLRDRNWNTARISVTNETVRSDTVSFAINYDWQVDDLGIQMSGSNHIAGQADGTITFSFSGKALNTFYRNRVGFCVLHPIKNLAGQPCIIEHPDGQTTSGIFPDQISPHEPFLNIRVMRWKMTSGQQFSVAFEGDVFETEDQRNWSDASYKTYCTPVSRPIPAEVVAGTEIRQTVTFRPVNLHPILPNTDEPIPVWDKTPYVLRPQIGLGHRREGPPLSAEEADRLRPLNLSHLRTDVYLNDADWYTPLSAARQDADLLDVPLELALFFGQDTVIQARQFITYAHSYALRIHSLLLFRADTHTTNDALLTDVASVFREQLPAVMIGGGTNAHFVDLNRHRFDFDLVDFVTYSLNPQAHAVDSQTIRENVAAQGDMVRSARVLSGGKPVHISPVTLAPRPTPDAKYDGTGPEPSADPRHRTTFGAEWTQKSLESLTQAGTASVTYYETHGPRGLLNGREVFPVFEVIDQFQKSALPLSPD